MEQNVIASPSNLTEVGRRMQQQFPEQMVVWDGYFESDGISYER